MDNFFLQKTGHRPIMETLFKAPTDAEVVVDLIRAHPLWTAMLSGKCTILLETLLHKKNDGEKKVRSNFLVTHTPYKR